MLENNVTCLIAKQKDECIDSWTPALKYRLVGGTSGPHVHLLLVWKHPHCPTAESENRQKLQQWPQWKGSLTILCRSLSHCPLCHLGEMPSRQRGLQIPALHRLSQMLVNSWNLSCMIWTQSLTWDVTSADAVMCLMTSPHCDKSRQ